jgi:hypothetical protein
MSVIDTGKTFANGEQLTADKLNQVIDRAEFNASEAVDGSTITLISGAMAVNDNGITEAKIENGAVTKNKLATDALELAYPVGSIYMNASNSDNPSTLLGFGTWVAFGAGRVPVGIDSGDTDFDTAEETGGSKVPALLDHTHNTPSGMLSGNASSGATGYGSGSYYSPIGNAARTTTSASSGNQSNGNLQPYIVVYMWKRTP